MEDSSTSRPKEEKPSEAPSKDAAKATTSEDTPEDDEPLIGFSEEAKAFQKRLEDAERSGALILSEDAPKKASATPQTEATSGDAPKEEEPSEVLPENTESKEATPSEDSPKDDEPLGLCEEAEALEKRLEEAILSGALSKMGLAEDAPKDPSEALSKEAPPSEGPSKETKPSETVSKEATQNQKVALRKAKSLEAMPSEYASKEATSSEDAPKEAEPSSDLSKEATASEDAPEKATSSEEVPKEAEPSASVPKDTKSKKGAPRKAKSLEAIPSKDAAKKEEHPEDSDSEESIEAVREVDICDRRAEKCLTARALKRILMFYIKPEFQENVNWQMLGFDGDTILSDEAVVELISQFLNSDRKLRRYEEAPKFPQILEHYRAFQSSNLYFGIDDLDPYNHTVYRYLGNDGTPFWAKQDFLVKMQSDLFAMFPDMKKPCRQYATIFLKSIEKSLGDTLEYFNEQRFSKNVRDIYEIMEEHVYFADRPLDEKRKNQIKGHYYDKEETDLQFVIDSFKTLFPAEYDDDALIRCLSEFCAETPPEKDPWNYADVFFVCRVLSDYFCDMTKNYPHIFKPYCQTTCPKPLYLRVFNYNQLRLVMTDELTDVINQKLGTNEASKSSEKYSLTIELGEILEKYGSNYLDGIDLLFSTIDRAGNLKPLRMLAGGFSYPSTMAFVDLMQRTTLCWKLFQKLNKNNAKKVLNKFAGLIKTTFNKKENCFTFIKRSAYEKFSKDVEKFCKPFKNVPTEEIPDLEPNKPVFKKHLTPIVNKLISKNIFPNRDEQFDAVFQVILRITQGPKNWRNSHVFDLIDQVQCMCFVMQYKDIYEFFLAHGDSIIKK
uniref:RING-type domain-containing protein n=2 Tax=Caenorhabditis tropicalis TaxID=1561998 RepID=A0A1I7TAE8_9PELO